ncbi:RbsD or FucU transport [Oxalobacteraceae bacterium]|nr:RbsD or FucU transport [Oxalobacteraceae bacterium]
MLKGIDPLLTPELLKVLAEMGHADTIAIVDANFTAVTLGQGKPLLRLPGIGLERACKAVLSVLPLELEEGPVSFMAVSDQPRDYRSAVQQRALNLCESLGGAGPDLCESVERYAFYDRVRGAYAIVQTGELQPFANLLLRKGVIAEALES